MANTDPDSAREEDESRERAHFVLRSSYIGFVVGNGDDDEDLTDAVKTSFAEAMHAADVPHSAIKTKIWDIGRSASFAEIMVYATTGLLAIAGAVKTLDEAAIILRKWWKELKKVRRQYKHGYFTQEALKLACVDDLVSRFGKTNLPRYDLMSSSIAVGRFEDGTWTPVGPNYFLIPDPHRQQTFLYVVDGHGTILHRADLPYFMDSCFEDSPGGITSSPWVDEGKLMMRLLEEQRREVRENQTRVRRGRARRR